MANSETSYWLKQIFKRLGGNPGGDAEPEFWLKQIAEKLEGVMATVSAQPDWNQSDSTKADYIKNKPTTSGYMLVEGTVDTDGFHASEGEPSWEDAVDFFTAGGRIVLKYTSTAANYEGDIYMVVTDYIEPEESLSCVNGYWAKPEEEEESSGSGETGK